MCGGGLSFGVRGLSFGVRGRSFRCAGRGYGTEFADAGGAVVVVVVVVVVGDVRATGLQFLLCMFSLFFVFLQTEKTFL